MFFAVSRSSYRHSIWPCRQSDKGGGKSGERCRRGGARAGGEHREDGEDKKGGNEGDDSTEKEIEKLERAEDTWQIQQIHLNVHLRCIDNQKKQDEHEICYIIDQILRIQTAYLHLTRFRFHIRKPDFASLEPDSLKGSYFTSNMKCLKTSALFLARLRFCLHYCIDRDAVK